MAHTFTDYNAARDYAEANASRLQVAHGIEYSKLDKLWVVRVIPRPENRYGCDLRCEAVEPEVNYVPESGYPSGD